MECIVYNMKNWLETSIKREPTLTRKKIHANKKFSSQLKIKKASTRNPSAANVCNSNENSVGCKLKLYENKSTFENCEMFSNFADGFFPVWCRRHHRCLFATYNS